MNTLGIDLGTSGVRAVVLDPDGTQHSQSVPVAPASRRDPDALWAAVQTVLGGLALDRVGAIAVAGTSGTLVATDGGGTALGPLSMYNDQADADALAAVMQAAPLGSPTRGHTSALARAVGLMQTRAVALVQHEADWIAGLLCGRFGFSDENNALKTGYDPVARTWPDWLAQAGLPKCVLPAVLPPGQAIAAVDPAIAARFGFPATALVTAGTTDGCASFLSTGAHEPGDAVTVLGSTLTVKVLSRVAIAAPAFGIYSHRLWENWLPGGASNSGGAVLAAHFSVQAMQTLSARIEPARETALHYYPLPRPGERFPINDPALQPRLMPRPADDALFLHGMLEGIARIEALGYRRLTELGAPRIRQVATVGGGAGNAVWTAIRARLLGVPVTQAADASAVHGAALVARRALTAPPAATAPRA